MQSTRKNKVGNQFELREIRLFACIVDFVCANPYPRAMKDPDLMVNTVIELDTEALRAVIAALDLYMRVSVGQWQEIVAVSSALLRSDVHSDGLCDALMELRGQWTSVEALRHPNAFLKIRNTHRSARVAYDVWQRLSETPDNTASPISGAHINVKPGSA